MSASLCCVRKPPPERSQCASAEHAGLYAMNKMRAPKEDFLASILSQPPRKETGVWERFQPNRDPIR